MLIGEAAVEKYRVVAVAVGLIVFLAMLLVLNRTKIGLLIRAGVENGEMVEALGYRITRLFVGVFMAGSALAGLGGVMWGLYREQVNAAMGGELLVLVFIVVIIGGLGSVTGCFIGALLVALAHQLCGLPGAEARAHHRHCPDGRRAAVAPARALSGDESMMPLSGDRPRSAVLSVALVLIVLGLALAPFLFPGAKPLNVAAKICIFIALAASYDLLLGYTGVVSFAHTMFYGVGSYGVAIALYSLGARWDAIGLGLLVALPTRGAAGAGDRAVFVAGADDLLRHDHARGRLRLRGARLATLLAHRRRGRAQLPACPTCCSPGRHSSRAMCSAWRSPAGR